MTIEALIPNFAAKSRLSLTFLSLKSVSYASIKRAETSFFASIIQNIELFSPKNLVVNTEYCIFAACLRLNARPKIVKKAENNEFLQLKNMNDKEFALNAAMNRMRKKLNHLTGDIESWKEDMANDYADFFRWHADDLYEAMAAKAILEPVYETAKELGLAALEESLRHNIEHLTDDLVYGDLERQSTGKMSNMAYGLELKAKQKMIQFFSAVQTVIAEGKKIEG